MQFNVSQQCKKCYEFYESDGKFEPALQPSKLDEISKVLKFEKLELIT